MGVAWLYSFCFFKQKTAYEMRISDWSSDVCSSDLAARGRDQHLRLEHEALAGHVVERVHRARIQALAALAVDHAETAAPADAPVAEVVADATVHRLRRALAQPRADDHAARMAVGRRDQARDVGDRKSTRLNSSH